MWRSRYGGLEISEMRRLRQLEEENRRLKAIAADQALDIRALKDVLAKTATTRGETRDSGGSHDHTCAVAASRLWAGRHHAARFPAAPPICGNGCGSWPNNGAGGVAPCSI